MYIQLFLDNTILDTEQTQQLNILDNTLSSYDTSNKKFFKTGGIKKL